MARNRKVSKVNAQLGEKARHDAPPPPEKPKPQQAPLGAKVITRTPEQNKAQAAQGRSQKRGGKQALRTARSTPSAKAQDYGSAAASYSAPEKSLTGRRAAVPASASRSNEPSAKVSATKRSLVAGMATPQPKAPTPAPQKVSGRSLDSLVNEYDRLHYERGLATHKDKHEEITLPSGQRRVVKRNSPSPTFGPESLEEKHGDLDVKINNVKNKIESHPSFPGWGKLDHKEAHRESAKAAGEKGEPYQHWSKRHDPPN